MQLLSIIGNCFYIPIARLGNNFINNNIKTIDILNLWFLKNINLTYYLMFVLFFYYPLHNRCKEMFPE